MKTNIEPLFITPKPKANFQNTKQQKQQHCQLCQISQVCFFIYWKNFYDKEKSTFTKLLSVQHEFTHSFLVCLCQTINRTLTFTFTFTFTFSFAVTHEHTFCVCLCHESAFSTLVFIVWVVVYLRTQEHTHSGTLNCVSE